MKKIKAKTKLRRGFMVPRKAAATGLVVVLAVAAFALSPYGKSATHAAGNKQYCAYSGGHLACLNAWDGGPFVRVYTHLNVANNTFQFGQASNGLWYLRYNGPSSWNGRCVGDAYNDPNNHVTSLDVCPGTLSNPNGGWGTNFKWISCTSNHHYGYEFLNVHSGKYLAPDLYLDNSAFTTLGPPTCFGEY